MQAVKCTNCSSEIDLKIGQNCKTCGKKYSPPGAKLILAGSILMLVIAAFGVWTIFQSRGEIFEAETYEFVPRIVFALVIINIVCNAIVALAGLLFKEQAKRALLLMIAGFITLLGMAAMAALYITPVIIIGLDETINFAMITIIAFALSVLFPAILYVYGAVKLRKYNKDLREGSSELTANEDLQESQPE